MPIPSPTSSRRSTWLLTVPLLAAALAYARVLTGEFMFDDSRAIERNLAVKDLSGFVRDHFFPALLAGGRPVTDLTFAVDYAIGRLDPRPYHAGCIAVHLLNTVLVFFFTRAVIRLAGAARAQGLALAVAGLFALHPIQTQAVSYMVQRAETLASACYLGTLLLLLRAERLGRTRRGAAAYAGALLVFAVGLASKAIVTTLPAVWLLLAWAVPGAEGRRQLASWKSRLLLALPIVALDLWFSVRTVGSLEGHADAGFSVPGLPPWTYLLSQTRVLVTYLRLLLWPSGQNVDWDFPTAQGLAEPSVLAAGLLLLALLGGALLLLARSTGSRAAAPGAATSRVVGFGVLWFFLLLAPTSSIIPLADLVMEHRLYLACWGLFTASAVALEPQLARLAGRRAVPAAVALVAVVWGALALATWRRNAVWETRLALWSDAAEKSPGKARVHLGLGYALREKRRYDESIRQYARGLEVVGTQVDLEMQLLRNLGSVLIYARRLNEADDVLRRAVAVDPHNVDVLINLGVLSQRRGDMPAAEAWARRVLAVQPGQGDALQLLGIAALERRDFAAAATLFEQAVRADPDDGIRLVNLGVAYDAQGRLPDACAAWRRALERRLDATQRERAGARLASRCGG